MFSLVALIWNAKSALTGLLALPSAFSLKTLREIAYCFLAICSLITLFYVKHLEKEVAASHAQMATLKANAAVYRDTIAKMTANDAHLQEQIDGYEAARAAESLDIDQLLSTPIPMDKNHVTRESLHSLNAASDAADRLLESSSK